jgi:hypothetical protein
MRHANPRADVATQCLDAVRLASDPARLQAAPAEDLVSAAATLAKGVVAAIDAGGLRVQRAAALDLLDNAGRTIGAELRRRR